MQTKSGRIYLTKTEVKEIKTLIFHALNDINYGIDGSYGDGQKINKKELGMAQNAIENLNFILDNAIN